MKKKTLKIIGKLSCLILLTSVLISALIIPIYAYQTTNNELREYYYYGGQSYNLAPIESLYYNWYTASDEKTVQRSINVPNILNLSPKSWFGADGTPIYNFATESFGPNGEGAQLFQSWDNFAGADYPTQVMIADNAYTTIGHGANKQKAYMYPGLNPDDVWDYFGEPVVIPATNLDLISYGINPSIRDGTNADFVIELGEFTTTPYMSTYLCFLQATANDLTQAYWKVDYSFDYAKRNPETDAYDVESVTNTFYLDLNANKEQTVVDDRTCEVSSTSLLGRIIHYENEINGTDIDHHSTDLIRWKNVQVRPASHLDVHFDSLIFSNAYLRPYSEEAIDDLLENMGDSSYASAQGTDVLHGVNSLWTLELFVPYQPPADITDLGPLGESIGGAVTGIMNAEIFPGVDLWVLLIIPFALGLTFTFIKFFAGG